MNYYKVVLDDKVIDVLESPVWIRRNPRGRIVICGIGDALGVVSSNAETIWHIAGTDPLGEALDNVKVIDIEEQEAKELQTLLGLGGEVTDTDTGIQTEFPEEPEEPEEVPKDATLAEVKRICAERLSAVCQQVIFDGVDVEMSDGSIKHFTLKVEDQLNLLSLATMAASGAQEIPYHAEGELCVFYSIEDINRIIAAATQFKTYHISYYNSLKNWIESMDDIAQIGSVAYGDPVPPKYCSVVLTELNQAAQASGE